MWTTYGRCDATRRFIASRSPVLARATWACSSPSDGRGSNGVSFNVDPPNELHRDLTEAARGSSDIRVTKFVRCPWSPEDPGGARESLNYRYPYHLYMGRLPAPRKTALF